jgi:hypothetical protein
MVRSKVKGEKPVMRRINLLWIGVGVGGALALLVFIVLAWWGMSRVQPELPRSQPGFPSQPELPRPPGFPSQPESLPRSEIPPRFPWPPPLASAETMIPRNWLSTREAPQLALVAHRLELALNEAKYRRWSYSSVPNGFALVSQMEQINSDGTPSPEPARWSTGLPSVANMTLLEFIKALANAQPGYYRVIVFIITNQPWSRTGEKPTRGETERWLAQGFNWLPPSIGELTYGPDYRTTALVYEFKKVSKDTDAALLNPSSISADDHLKKAGGSSTLNRGTVRLQ